MKREIIGKVFDMIEGEVIEVFINHMFIEMDYMVPKGCRAIVRITIEVEPKGDC